VAMASKVAVRAGGNQEKGGDGNDLL